MRIKKMLFLFLYLLFIALFVSCGRNNNLDKSPKPNSENSDSSTGDLDQETNADLQAILDSRPNDNNPDGSQPADGNSAPDPKVKISSNKIIINVVPGNRLSLAMKNLGEEIFVYFFDTNNSKQIAIRRIHNGNSAQIAVLDDGSPILIKVDNNLLIFSSGGTFK
jgi:hypothetical protein